MPLWLVLFAFSSPVFDAMPEFLSDPSPAAYMIATVAALAAVVVWYQNQVRRNFCVAAAGVGVFAGLVAVDGLYEGPREEAVRRTEEMAAAAGRHDPAAVLPHLSDDFRYLGLTKGTFADARSWDLARQFEARVAVWDFDREYVRRPDPEAVIVGFLAKVETNAGQGVVFVEATFAREPDGAFRLRTFRLFRDPLRKGQGEPMSLPGAQ